MCQTNCAFNRIEPRRDALPGLRQGSIEWPAWTGAAAGWQAQGAGLLPKQNAAGIVDLDEAKGWSAFFFWQMGQSEHHVLHRKFKMLRKREGIEIMLSCGSLKVAERQQCRDPVIPLCPF